MLNTQIDVRCARGLWLLCTNQGVLVPIPVFPSLGPPRFFSGGVSLQSGGGYGLVPRVVDPINGCFTVQFQLASPQTQYTMFLTPALGWTNQLTQGARFSFAPSGPQELGQYLVSISDGTGNTLGYLGADSNGTARLVSSASDALVTTLAARLPAKFAPFENLIAGEVMLYDGANFTGNQAVVLDGSQHLDVLARVGLLQGITSVQPGPRTVVSVGNLTLWQPASLILQRVTPAVYTQVAVHPAPFSGAWALQVFKGDLVTSTSGSLGTRPVSGSVGSNDFLYFYEAPPEALPPNPLPGAIVVQFWNNMRTLSLASPCAVRNGKLTFPGTNATPSTFYALQEDSPDNSPEPLWSFRDVATLDYVYLDPATKLFSLQTQADGRALFERVVRNPNLEGDSNFPQQVGSLSPGQVAFFSLYEYTQNSWVVEQSIPDTSLLGGFQVDSVLLAEDTQVVLFDQPNYAGNARTLSTNTSQLNPGGSQGLSFGSFQLHNIVTPAAELIQVSAELVSDYVYTRGAGFGPATSLYRVVLQHHDGQGNPIPSESFQLLSEEPVTVSFGGQTCTLSAGTPIPALSDITGRLTLMVWLAQDSLSVPAIKVQTPNMPAGSWALIHPDEDIVEKLSAVTGDELLNGIPASSAGAAKSGLLAQGTTPDDAGAIAAALNHAASIITYDDDAPSEVHPSDGLAGQLARGTRSAQLGAPGRPVARASAMLSAHWSLSFGADGKPTFTRYDTAQQALAAFFARTGSFHAVGAPLPSTAPAAQPHVMGVLDDIWDEIEGAAADLRDWTVATLKAAASRAKELVESALAFVSYVKDGVLYVAELALDTAERVCRFAKLLFDKLGVALGKVIDFFAFLFDWDRIKAFQQQASNAIDSSCAALAEGAKKVLAPLRQDIKTRLQSLDASLDQQLQTFRKQIGFDTPTVPAEPPGARLRLNPPAIRDSLTDWLTSKLKELMPDFSGPGFSFAGVNGSVIQQSLEKQWTALTDPRFLLQQKPVSLQDLITQLLSGVGTTQGAPLGNLPDALWLVLGGLDQLGHQTLQTLESMVDAFFDMLDETIKAIGSMMETTLSVPFLSDLLERLLGWRGVTVQQLVSLLAAVPAALVKGLQGGSSEGLVSVGGPLLDDGMKYALMAGVCCIRGIFEPIQDGVDGILAGDGLDLPYFIKLPGWLVSNAWKAFSIGMQVGLDCIRQWLTRPSSLFDKDSVETWYWWATMTRPILRVALAVASPRWPMAGRASPYLSSALGLGTYVFTMFHAAKTQPGLLMILDNSFQCGPPAFKPLRAKEILESTEGISLAILVGLDIGFYWAAYGFCVKMMNDAPPPRKQLSAA